MSPNLEDLPCELVAGDGCIHEELLGLKFRISPHSFFQVSKLDLRHEIVRGIILNHVRALRPACVRVLPLQVNTGAAEVLYSAVGEWAQLDQDSTVLDVCCGTGTIGISLAKVGTTLVRIPGFFLFFFSLCLHFDERWRIKRLFEKGSNAVKLLLKRMIRGFKLPACSNPLIFHQNSSLQ